MKRSFWSLAVFVVLVLVMVFSMMVTINADGGKNFVFIMSHQRNAFMVGLEKAMEKAAKHYDVNVKIVSGDFDPAKQASQMDDAITAKVDGVMIDPATFEGEQASIQACVNAKIPIITIHELCSNQDICNGFVGVNQKTNGVKLMTKAVSDLHGKGNICVMNGHMGDPAQIDLRAGFKEILDKNPNIKVIFEGTGNWIREDALRLSENWLSTGKKIDSIVTENDGMGVGVVDAVKSANLSKIYIYGTDGEPEALKEIQAGEYTATIRNDSDTEAMVGLGNLIKATQGKSFQKIIYVESTVVTKANVGKYIQ